MRDLFFLAQLAQYDFYGFLVLLFPGPARSANGFGVGVVFFEGFLIDDGAVFLAPATRAIFGRVFRSLPTALFVA